MIEVRVPNYTVKDNTVKLECHYDMEDEKLYSVKWYKDGHEFYRYLPRDHPPATLFPQNGITVDVSAVVKLLKWNCEIETFIFILLASQLFRLVSRPAVGEFIFVGSLSVWGFWRSSEF